MSRTSGLQGHNLIVARSMVMQAAYLTLKNRDAVHYSQNPVLRWEGINRNLKAWRGQYPNEGDCSGIATWWLWNGLDHFHIRDVVNGENWQRGYTGTMLTHGIEVKYPIRGDLIIYGKKWPGEHVALYVGNNRVISHGSEAGPLLLLKNYRPDILSIRRYI